MDISQIKKQNNQKNAAHYRNKSSSFLSSGVRDGKTSQVQSNRMDYSFL